MFSHQVFWAPLNQKSIKIPSDPLRPDRRLSLLVLGDGQLPRLLELRQGEGLGFRLHRLRPVGSWHTEEIFPCSQCSECIVTIVPFPGWFWFDSLIPMIFASSHHSKIPNTPGQMAKFRCHSGLFSQSFSPSGSATCPVCHGCRERQRWHPVGRSGVPTLQEQEAKQTWQILGLCKSSPKVAWFMVFACSHLTILLLLIKWNGALGTPALRIPKLKLQTFKQTYPEGYFKHG